ncbi:MAG: trypsin-like peptidase domain-containing protein [Caldilineales bacterium]
MKQSMVSALLFVSLLLSGCVAAAPPPTITNSPQSAAIATSTLGEVPADTPTLVPTDTATPTNTATSTLDTPTPTDTATPEPKTPAPTDTPVPAANTPDTVSLTPSELFDQVSPSVAFVETDRSSGSGVLIEDGYIVTNAHVVWPFRSVRVVFPDGSEFRDAPVLAWDLIGDLAVVGPLETDLAPVTFLTDERLLVGKDVYLIGYPGEVERFPQPTISRGLVSRLRNWPAIDMTYLQTDATIAGGQSGGVLVTERGEIAGISGNTFPDTSFALAASAQDVSARVQRMLADEDIDGLGQRPVLDEASAKTRHMVVLGADSPSSTYALHGEKGEQIDVSVEGIPEFAIWVVNSYGEPVAWANDTVTGKERAKFELGDAGLYFIDVFNLDGGAGVGTIKSETMLTPLKDFDDRSRPTIGNAVAGALDYPTDVDPYRLYLEEGQEVNIRVESVMIDPIIAVHKHEIDPDEKDQPADLDSGDGLFGRDAEMSYRAPESDIYFILVAAQDPSEAGGYLLTVRETQEGDPTPMAPLPTPTPIRSALGPMATYESELLPGFRLQVPSNWGSTLPTSDFDALCRHAPFCRYSDDEQVVLVISEEQLPILQSGEAGLDNYAKGTERSIIALDPETKMTRSEKIITDQGIPVYVLDYVAPEGVLRVVSYLAVHEGIGLTVSFLAPTAWEGLDAETVEYFEAVNARVDEFADYMINTLQVVD